MVRKKNPTDFYSKLKAQNPEITLLGVYKGCASKIPVKCNRCGCEWSPIASSLLRGHGCPKCAGVKLKSHAEFVSELQSLRDDVAIIGTYVKALEKVTFRFLKCGHECEISPAHILGGRGCPECGRSHRGESQRLTMEIFLERLHKIDSNLVVREGGMYINFHTLMPLHCNACGYEYEITPHDVLSNHGCPNCHRACTSFFEQFIYHSFVHILGKSKVISREKNAIGVELDIYIPELKAAIEPGSWYWHKKLVAKDRKKQLLCRSKGIKLMTIYDHYDATIAPFDNCFVVSCNLTSRKNTDKLIEITKKLLTEFGLGSNLNINEWKEIKKKAQIDSRRMSTEEFKEELSKINDRIVVIGDFAGANNKIEVKCKTCNHKWAALPTSLRSGTGCPECGGTLKMTDNKFVERLSLLQPNILPLTEYINIDTNVTIQCKVCDYIWSTQPYHLLAKSGRTGCPRCSNRVRRTHDDFVAEVAKLSPTIKIVGVYVSRDKSILVECRKCGKIWQSYPGNLLRGSSCKDCNLKNAIQQRSRKVRCITTGEVFNTLKEAAEKYKISDSAICMCCNNSPKHKHAGGQEWEYYFLNREESAFVTADTQ